MDKIVDKKLKENNWIRNTFFTQQKPIETGKTETVMKVDQAVIQVVGEHECPYYKIDDEFKLSGHVLYLPCEKPACMMLLDDIRRVLPRISKDNPKLSFYCSGCTGLLKLDYEKKDIDDFSCTGPSEKPEANTIVELLSHLPFFQSQKLEAIRNLIPFLKYHTYEKGDILIRKGQRSSNLFILVSGKVEILDDNVVIALLGKGEIFGEMSLISGESATATVRALESGSYLYIDGKFFRKIFNRFPQFQIYLVRMLVRKLALSNIQRIKDFSTVFSGNLSEIKPSELFQALNVNQKTGQLVMNLPKGVANLKFLEGELVFAEYNQMSGCEAFYEILKEKEGKFSFSPGLPDEGIVYEKIGNMMWLLMMGSQKIEQEKKEED